MRYFFTREDFEVLNRRIDSVNDRIKLAAKEMGLSCQQTSETFHDNFGFEQAERDRGMWSSHIRQLIEVKNNAEVIVPGLNEGKVRMGRVVRILDLDTKETKTFRVGSYMILDGYKTEVIPSLSYDAPLPKALLGAGEGDYREVFFGGEKHRYVILKVE